MKNTNTQFINPACNFIKNLKDQLLIAIHIERSTAALNNTPRMLDTLKKLLDNKEHKILIKEINYLQQETIDTLKTTKNILVCDFSKTNAQILISMWNALLTAVEDTLTQLLLKAKVRHDFFNSINIKQSRKEILINETDEDKLRGFITKWQTPGTNKVEYIESQLAHFDLVVDIPKDLKIKLVEMHQIRNCLVHRAGIADKQIIDNAPSLSFEIGQAIIVNKNMFIKYYDAACQYGKMFLAAVLTCKHLHVK